MAVVGWAGHSNGVHGVDYAFITTQSPIRGLLRVLMQKRGMYGVAKEAGGTVPANRALIDGALPIGGSRTIANSATLAEISAAEMDKIADTQTVPTVVADLSGNGGGTIA